MRTFVIGDIHGCSTALDLLLREVAPQADDTLITLGDYVDRGPDSRGVIDRLLSLQQRTRLVPILGNHEILMLDARLGLVDMDSWLAVGGRQTMASYADAAHPDFGAVPDSHWDFMENHCQRFFETDSHIYAHAGVNAMLPLADQSDDWLFWRRFDEAHAHFSGKILICGHTAQKTGLPLIKSGAICIDTWAYGEGWLTALDIATQTYLQANQRGELRRLSIDDIRAKLRI